MPADPAEHDDQGAEIVPFAPPPGRDGRRRRDPARFAAAQQRAFADRNLHVGQSQVVHATTWLDWIDDLTLPAPACRQGFTGHGTHSELSATRRPVTCRRCRRLRGEDDTADTGSTAVQATLF
ncbi:hypothetical protein FHX42_001503 [Saccharopolyspora lacisalsi]|uniref:Uncharacterized protein n=1 Tax=Halosaccharopolyspora lacisalsi TaxID=1000566 RepID=A0A839DRN2_9PSEU|nr:hypothetical protein [Halosaccharopolyspora lacisalsi]MBA8823923.1 hypothetical protein [Halosaccharopolyspora lacisalsi]MBA8824174.1 hypothetical protein [Halosaccharopolyspora lacisalsi]